MKKKKRILIITTYEGHLSIGQAIEQFLAKQEDCEIKFIIEDIPLRSAYLTIYQFFPSSYKTAYSLSQKSAALRDQAHNIFRMKYDSTIEEHLNEFRPDVVISAFYMVIPSLVAACQLRNIPLFNVITDPLTLHLAVVAPTPAINCGFDAKTTRVIREMDPHVLVEQTGWFVRDAFEESYDKKTVRKSLELDPETLTILVASGSEGTNLVMKIMPILLLSDKPTQVIVACGNNMMLQSLLDQFKKLMDTLGNQNKLTILGFTDHLHKYMQAADLIVGKAGPNSVFEAVATRTPFFAITHISGQEDGNLEIIKNYKLGYVEENIVKLLQLLKSIIDQPAQLKKFEKPIEKLAKYNHQAKEKLLDLIERAGAH